MGKYINRNSKEESAPALGKVEFLKADGAEVISKPDSSGEDIVLVVSNGLFEAAAYIYNQREYDHFTDPSDDRKKTWLKYPSAKDIAQ